ncbi:GntR family transcriptional regulator [Brucella sp. NM4]|uniref:GntR family transcriptional regulator n=1 Tax=Brucella/Ochrobactrum group TaxID=2826938 RepID=UPI0024BC3C34|nr:GntR family transcriptional regulator [Brucella sp. NM4]WHS30532.1 GntR family transcriptional regulator [Brucella sp. NM4]WHT45124.1 GntR family transcriptional regulator [Ochrobactrum sp. SSR]
MVQKQVIKANLSEQIYRNLRLSLMEGEYRPGERLTISGVAELYGTSITPVREAIMRLASEQALNFVAATSVAVPVLTPRDLREIVAIRNNLEGMAAFRVGQTATGEIVEEFEKLNASFTAAAAQDPREAAQTNREFHFLILRRAELPYVETICENMWTLMGPFLRTFHEEMPVRQLSGEDHQHFRFIEALRRNDPDAARNAMQADIQWANELVARIEEKNSENAR